MKKFDNIADDGQERALRRGFTVPDGAVNVAWVKAPTLNPKNNVVIIDTSKVTLENSISNNKVKKVAFSNLNGILEDEDGNQIWDEEYPLISDVFAIEETDIKESDYTDDSVFPFMHVSRFFHVDEVNLAYTGRMELYQRSDKIKIVDRNGNDYVDAAGKRRYKIYVISPSYVATPVGVQSAVYRVFAFLDCNPDVDELYMTYNKVRVTSAGSYTEQDFSYQERVNVRPYFKYLPEETDIVDRAQELQKIYSSKPSNLKEQILGGSQNNVHGWKYFVPRKAIPDPRVFQLFRWRVACEFTRSMTEAIDELAPEAGPIIKAGVIIPNGGNHLHTNANYFFYQLNQTDYNFSNIKFVNPVNSPNLTASQTEQQAAAYWHVNIDTVSLTDLSKFDVLIWAPTASSVNVAPYLPKINYFTETVGGTFIFESSSSTTFSNLPYNASTATKLDNMIVTPSGDTAVTATTARLYDATADDPNDTFSSYGMWKKWPPNVNEILNTYSDTGSILASASVIAGWDLTSTEKTKLSGYENLSNIKFQYIKQYGPEYKPVIEASDVTVPATFRKVMIHKKFNSGGNIFVSTNCLFDDHMFEINGNLATKSIQVPNITSLSQTTQANFKRMVSGIEMQTEMKLRINTMLFATIFKPSPTVNTPAGALTNEGNKQSTTVYSDWVSSWVINPEGDVLSDKERFDNSFALLPINASADPVWQRVLSKQSIQEIIQTKIKVLDPDGTNPIFNTSSGATKRYFMLVTNPQVQTITSDLLSDTSIPTAWTTAYSPKFAVPVHLGSYVVRDEMIAGTGVGEGRKIYPPKPYDLRASASYYTTSQTSAKVTANVTINGTYRRMIKQPDYTEQTQVWVPGTPGYMTSFWMHWNSTNGFNSMVPGHPHQGGGLWKIPAGVDTWSDVNYQLHPTTNFPFMGQWGFWTIGSSGSLTTVFQQFINQMIFFSQISGPYIKEDGYYGQITFNKIREYQAVRHAQIIDGTVDAETLSLMGFDFLTLLGIPGWATNAPSVLVNFAYAAQSEMDNRNIGDDNYQSHYMRQSRYRNHPSVITEGFLLKFVDNVTMFRVSILPYLGGTASNDLRCDWVDAGVNLDLTNYDYSRGNPGPIYNMFQRDDTTAENIPLNWMQIDLPDVYGNSVIFRLSQSYTSGRGDSRVLGIRDVGVAAKRFIAGTPGSYQIQTRTVPGQTYVVTENFTYTTTMQFETGIAKNFDSSVGLSTVQSNGDIIYGARFDPNSLVITPAEYANAFKSTFVNTGSSPSDPSVISNAFTLTYNGYNNTLSSENFIAGQRIGNGSTTYYTKSSNNVISPFFRQYGWVNKEDGVTLICNADGTPFGFPTALPNQVTYSMHFVRYNLSSFNTDQTLYYGFYDAARQEFVTNSFGEPDISFYDYIRRGPQNIFIAVMTTYELDSTYNIPGRTDTVDRPFKWAMPVYGVTYGLESKIQILPLSDGLGNDDVWALPIKTGAFSKDVALRPRSEGSLTNYLKDYQGYKVRAHYDVPEARSTAWSAMYGRPFSDIANEIPFILDDNTIQVKQYPILISQQNTVTPSLADPWYPVLKIQGRNTLQSPWYDIPFTAVKDYSIWDGTITFKDTLRSNDPRLLRVTYTSQRKAYQLKHDGTHRLNLNPYVNNPDIPVNQPLYIYLLPDNVVDSVTNIVIPASVQTRTLRLSYDSNIFNASSVDYNPLAVLIGIVYITNSFDINDLSVIDTRKRGGGARAEFSTRELVNLNKESSSYWDIVPTYATSYQKGGFVIIQLPKELKNDLQDSDIIEVIERNITLGTRYKLQDMNGNDW